MLLNIDVEIEYIDVEIEYLSSCIMMAISIYLFW